MSNFWETSDGKAVEKKTEHESGGAFELIPDGTKLLAFIDEAGWKAGFDHGPDVIKLRWTVLAPGDYKGRKVFQNVKVNDSNPTTADNAKRMLMAIDQNAGGALSKLTAEPQDNQLMAALVNKPMVIRMAVWSMNDKEGNWVSAVSPHKKAAGQTAAKAESPKPEPTLEPTTVPVQVAGDFDLDMDVPF